MGKQLTEAIPNSGSAGYMIDWKLGGDISQQFIHFTLPHHRAILTDKAVPTSLVLSSTTKGKMVAYVGSTWYLYEPERLTVGFLPDGWADIVTPAQVSQIRKQAEKDGDLDFEATTNLDSMYFAGKGLAKFGLLCLVVADVLKDVGPLREKCLNKLKAAFSRYSENRQMFPLVYDTTWKGLISIQGLNRGPLTDFGNSWYK
jgi:endo-1,3(4)-beta-glucanase